MVKPFTFILSLWGLKSLPENKVILSGVVWIFLKLVAIWASDFPPCFANSDTVNTVIFVMRNHWWTRSWVDGGFWCFLLVFTRVWYPTDSTESFTLELWSCQRLIKIKCLCLPLFPRWFSECKPCWESIWKLVSVQKETSPLSWQIYYYSIFNFRMFVFLWLCQLQAKLDNFIAKGWIWRNSEKENILNCA